MKQVLFTLIFVWSSATTYAQLQKGTKLLEGNFGVFGNSRTDEFSLFGGINDSETRFNSISIAPRIGWFTSENSLLGIGLIYENQTNKSFNLNNGLQTNTFILSNNLYSVNPYFTRFSPLTDKLYLATTVNATIGIGTERGEIDDQEIEGNVFAIGVNLAPGLIYFISEKWTLQASIGQLFYQFRQSKLTSDVGQQGDRKNVINDYGINFSANTFRIGFQYFINRKSE